MASSTLREGAHQPPRAGGATRRSPLLRRLVRPKVSRRRRAVSPPRARPYTPGAPADTGAAPDASSGQSLPAPRGARVPHSHEPSALAIRRRCSRCRRAPADPPTAAPTSAAAGRARTPRSADGGHGDADGRRPHAEPREHNTPTPVAPGRVRHQDHAGRRRRAGADVDAVRARRPAVLQRGLEGDGSNPRARTARFRRSRSSRSGSPSATRWARSGWRSIPDFATNHWVYVFYSQAKNDNGDPEDNRVVRFTERDGLATERTLIIKDLPAGICCHNGGRSDSGHDGKLYVTVGRRQPGRQGAESEAPERQDPAAQPRRLASRRTTRTQARRSSPLGFRNPFGHRVPPDDRRALRHARTARSATTR